jgi:hypothetical protein
MITIPKVIFFSIASCCKLFHDIYILKSFLSLYSVDDSLRTIILTVILHLPFIFFCLMDFDVPYLICIFFLSVLCNQDMHLDSGYYNIYIYRHFWIFFTDGTFQFLSMESTLYTTWSYIYFSWYNHRLPFYSYDCLC